MDHYDDEIIFPVKLDTLITNSHHNLYLKPFVNDIAETCQLIVDLPITCTTHKGNPDQDNFIDLSDQHCQYVRRHALTSTQNVFNLLPLHDMDYSK